MKHLALALALTLSACSFTNEPDPGGFAESKDGGAGQPDLGGVDAFAAEDYALPPPVDAAMEPDAGAADAFPDDPPDMGELPDGAADAAMDGDLPDGDLPDGDLPDGDLPDGAPDTGLDGGFEPDLGPVAPEDLCDRACEAITACGPGPDPAECRRECLAEDDDHPGAAARLDDCVAAHIADGRCDVPALQTCMSDEPLPLDPHCVVACDALSGCEDLPARPDCAETCTDEPGPDRQRLARCVDEHVAGGRCDGLGFLTCGSAPPTPADRCAFVCDSLAACDLDDADCRADCPGYDDAARAAAIDCAAIHLDRDRCAVDAHRACRGE